MSSAIKKLRVFAPAVDLFGYIGKVPAIFTALSTVVAVSWAAINGLAPAVIFTLGLFAAASVVGLCVGAIWIHERMNATEPETSVSPARASLLEQFVVEEAKKREAERDAIAREHAQLQVDKSKLEQDFARGTKEFETLKGQHQRLGIALDRMATLYDKMFSSYEAASAALSQIDRAVSPPTGSVKWLAGLLSGERIETSASGAARPVIRHHEDIIMDVQLALQQYRMALISQIPPQATVKVEGISKSLEEVLREFPKGSLGGQS